MAIVGYMGISTAQSIATTMNTALDSLSGLQVAQAGATVDEANVAFVRSLQILVALIVGGIVLGLGMGFYVARSLANPLKLMVAAANGIAAGGLNQEITLDRTDEVATSSARSRGRRSVWPRPRRSWGMPRHRPARPSSR